MREVSGGTQMKEEDKRRRKQGGGWLLRFGDKLGESVGPREGTALNLHW